ncbi:MAG: hypothetical protein ABJD68_11690 [Nakamurella sp.]
MSATEFFSYACDVLSVNPPHATDYSVLARIAHLGIGVGRTFDTTSFSEADLSEIEAGASAAQQALTAALPTLGTRVNGWTTFTDTMGVHGNYYFKRAVITLIGFVKARGEAVAAMKPDGIDFPAPTHPRTRSTRWPMPMVTN